MKYLIIVLALYAFPAGACQLAGKYRIFGMNVSGGFPTSQMCQVNINMDGKVRNGFCKIRNEFGDTQRNEITGGKWKISKCVVAGTLETPFGKTRIEAAINGETIAGRAKGKGSLAVFSGVKIP